MSKTLELLLVETVDNLGIVGDVVKVRSGYARNYLLPRGLASTPSQELVEQLKGKRADAEKQLAELRKQREAMIQRLDGYQINMNRACNDQGILYGAVSQQDIATHLKNAGFDVKPREVRIAETIKRLGDFEIHVKFASDLESVVNVHIEADRELDLDDEREEMEFDNEGNLIEKPARQPRAAAAAEEAPAAEGDTAAE